MNEPGPTDKGPFETRLPLFSSDRERRLWIWTLLLVLTIYATLGLASTLAGAITQGMAAVLFITGMLLVGITVLTQGLKIRPGRFELAVAIGAATVYFFLFMRLAVPERSHLFEFGVVAVLIYEALTERAVNGRNVPFPAITAIVLTALVGVLDECIQLFLPSRVFDPTDMFFNLFAAALAVTSSFAIGKTRALMTQVNSSKDNR